MTRLNLGGKWVTAALFKNLIEPMTSKKFRQ
jgi:hypothetical protein